MFFLTYKSTRFTIVLLLSWSLGMGQTNQSAALDRLERSQLITSGEKGLLLNRDTLIKMPVRPTFADAPPDYSRKYEQLGLVVRAKEFSTSGTSSLFMFTPAPAASRNLGPAVIHAELDSFIQRLVRADLVSDETRAELIRMNNKGQLGWELEAANFAAQAANQEYFLRPEKLKKFADSLRSTKVISEENYNRLMEKSRRGKLHRYAELLSYLDFCSIIVPANLPRDTMRLLHALYSGASRVYPGLRYDSIGFRVEKDKMESFEDFDTYNLVTTIRIGDKSYAYSGYYYSVYKNNEDSLPPQPDSYYILFNKVLADQSSPYRLHGITIGHIGQEMCGVIALTEEQFKQFNWTYDGAQCSYMSMSYESYSNRLTQQKIRAAIKTYDSLGLFSHLSPKERDSCIAVVDAGEVNYHSDILKCFKDLVFDLDMKYGIDSAHYASITQLLAQRSKGAFQPIKIVDGYTYEHPNFTYGFTLNNKAYSASLHQDGKWLDPGFWALIDSAVKENNPAGRFYNIYPSDGLTEIYLTNEQYSFLRNHRLLEFTDPESDEK